MRTKRAITDAATTNLLANGSPAWINLNGQKLLLNRITRLHQIGPARWVGVASQRPFEIEGTGRDCSLQWGAIGDEALHCTSLAAAIHTIENA
jgi:hypothetical protein